MLGLAVALALTAVPARAGVDPAVDRLYWHRNEGKNLDANLSQLEALLKASPDDPELLWREGRALFRRGEKQARKADALADYLQAEDFLQQAVALAPATVEAHFFYGVAMGKRGETQGILKSLFLIKPIRKEMNEVLRLDPNYGGAYRVLGEILWQVPGFAGGDKKLALQDFEKAVSLTPNYTSNYQPLAEAYVHYDRKDDALRTLKAVAAVKDPTDPAQYPDDLADANKLLAKLAP